MRAAAILGPGNISRWVERFRGIGGAQWTSGAPASSATADLAVIFGGDGTVHSNLALLVTLGLPVLVVPCGSGNDFARALNLRNVDDSLGAWRQFAHGGKNVRHVDLGIIRELSGVKDLAGGASPAPAPHYFGCVAGLGIDTEIARRANALPKWLRAHGGYALYAISEICRFAPFPVRVIASEAAPAKTAILAAFANTPAYGGGMKIAPRAQLDDGSLDVCIVRGMNRFKLLCLFPTVYFGGHLGFREVEYSKTQTARVETKFPCDVYADGEYVCQTPVEFSIARNALAVIVPA